MDLLRSMNGTGSLAHTMSLKASMVRHMDTWPYTLASIACCSSSLKLFGQRLGRELRSSSPGSPSALNLASHL